MELSDRPLNFSANSNSMYSTLQDIRDTDLSRTSSYLGIRSRVCVQQLVCEDNILGFFYLKSSLLLLTSLSKMTRKSNFIACYSKYTYLQPCWLPTDVMMDDYKDNGGMNGAQWCSGWRGRK